jgi:hypothetical protein
LWAVVIMKLLIMQFSPVSCCFLHLRFKHLHQHPVLEYPPSSYVVPSSSGVNCKKW